MPDTENIDLNSSRTFVGLDEWGSTSSNVLQSPKLSLKQGRPATWCFRRRNTRSPPLHAYEQSHAVKEEHTSLFGLIEGIRLVLTSRAPL